MNDRVRIGALLVVVLLTGALCVAYGSVWLWEHPSGGTVGDDRTAYDGESVMWFGHVQSLEKEATTAVVTVDGVEFTVTGLSSADGIQVGADIQIAGTLTDGGTTLVAEEIVVDHASPRDRYYVYLTSILGGLVAAGFFLRYWRINWRRLRFESRGDV